MKSMCRHQTLYGLQKHCPKKIHKAPCRIFYTSKKTTINKGTKVGTSKLQPGELVHMEFDFYNVTSIHSFISVLKVVCAKTIMIWFLPTTSKRVPIFVISFILTTQMNKQHPCKRVRINKDRSLANST